MTSKITEAQEKTLSVLEELGGWSTHWQLIKHGASSSAARALIKHGFVEERKLEGHDGFEMTEWRAIKPTGSNVKLTGAPPRFSAERPC